MLVNNIKLSRSWQWCNVGICVNLASWCVRRNDSKVKHLNVEVHLELFSIYISLYINLSGNDQKHKVILLSTSNVMWQWRYYKILFRNHAVICIMVRKILIFISSHKNYNKFPRKLGFFLGEYIFMFYKHSCNWSFILTNNIWFLKNTSISYNFWLVEKNYVVTAFFPLVFFINSNQIYR